MARLGDLVRAKALVRRAARAFGPKEAVARARCVVAEAEIALVSRDLGWPAKALDAARATLEAHGDRVNAAHARISRPGASSCSGASTRPSVRLLSSTPTLPARVEGRPRAGRLRGSRCDASGRSRRARRSIEPRAPRVTPVSLR